SANGGGLATSPRLISNNEPLVDLDEPPTSAELEEGLRPYRKALAELMRAEALRRGDVAAAFELVTEVASELLGVERASVWRFRDDRTTLDCADLFERTPRRHSRGESLPAASFPRYFTAL